MSFFRTGLLVCLLVSVFVSGCSEEAINPQAKAQLDLGLSAYQAGDDRKAIAQADIVLSGSSKGSLAMQAYYLRGMACYRLGDFDRARDDLQQVDRKSNNTQLRIRAMDSLGEIAYRRGDMVGAESYFEQVVELAERGEKPADHAHYRLGCIFQRLSRWQEADVHFQRVIFLFSRSDLARQSRLKVNGRKWTIQVGSYENRHNAEVAAESFRRAKMKTYIAPAVRSGGMTFLLQVGRWEHYEQAVKQLDAVRKMKADAFLQVTR